MAEMTPQKALEILEMFLHKQCNLQRTEFAYSDIEVYCAVSMAKNALEKQIPKKPTDKTLEYDGYYGRCPGCNRVIYDYKDRNRCYNCGQALDWSDTE